MVKFCLGIFILIFLCCICSLGIFALFGHFYVGETCVWKGFLTSETTLSGPCLDLKEYKDNEISFKYSNLYTLEKTRSVILIYQKDPKKTLDSEFIQNVVVASQNVKSINLKDKGCDYYINDFLFPTLQDLYSDSKVLSFNETNLNGNFACQAMLELTNENGKTLKQKHYGIFKGDNIYYLTVTLDSLESEPFDFDSIVNSFRIE